jgi:hypothetical protein
MEKLKNIFRKLNNKKGNDQDLIRWAQTEYGKDWVYAYNMMKQGKTIVKGVTY